MMIDIMWGCPMASNAPCNAGGLGGRPAPEAMATDATPQRPLYVPPIARNNSAPSCPASASRTLARRPALAADRSDRVTEVAPS